MRLERAFGYHLCPTFWSKQGWLLSQNRVLRTLPRWSLYTSDNIPQPLSQCTHPRSIMTPLDLMAMLLLMQGKRGLGASLQHCTDVPRAYDPVLVLQNPQITWGASLWPVPICEVVPSQGQDCIWWTPRGSCHFLPWITFHFLDVVFSFSTEFWQFFCFFCHEDLILMKKWIQNLTRILGLWQCKSIFKFSNVSLEIHTFWLNLFTFRCYSGKPT